MRAVGNVFCFDDKVVSKKEVTHGQEKMTDKNIKIKTTGGTTVNVVCSYAEDTTLEALLLSYLEREVVEKVPA